MRLLSRLILGAVITLTVLVAAAPAAAQPVPEPSPAPQIGPSPEPDPGFFDVGGRIRQSINQWFADLVNAALDPVLDLLGRTVLSTPDFTEQSRVRELWGISAAMANSFFVILVIIAGALVMGHETVQTSYSVKEMAPRVVFGFVSANVSLLLAGLLIDAANGFSQAFLGQGVGPAEATGVIDVLVLAAMADGSIFFVLIGLVVAVMALLLLAVYVMRIAVVVILIAGAPVALACHALPQTEGLAQLWWRGLAAALGIQVAQSLVLITALRIFFGADGRSTLGLSVGGGLIDLLVITCLLWILLRIPIWASKAAFASRGSSTARMIKSFVVYKVLRKAASGGAL